MGAVYGWGFPEDFSQWVCDGGLWEAVLWWERGIPVTVFYGTEKEADLYGILAYWSKCDGMIFDGDEYPSTMEDILKRGHTCNQENRCKGINIGCYDDDINKLKYPLKLVSASYNGTYEECDGKSYNDPNQGFYKTYW